MLHASRSLAPRTLTRAQLNAARFCAVLLHRCGRTRLYVHAQIIDQFGDTYELVLPRLPRVGSTVPLNGGFPATVLSAVRSRVQAGVALITVEI